MPSLFLTGRLARIAEQDTAGRWRITPKTVRSTGGDRARVQALLTELARLHRGVLPAELVADIKRWGGFYGRVAVATVIILQFDSRDHLAELIGHPRLAGRLAPFDAGERALAVTPTETLPEVEQILSELGVVVEYGLPDV